VSIKLFPFILFFLLHQLLNLSFFPVFAHNHRRHKNRKSVCSQTNSPKENGVEGLPSPKVFIVISYCCVIPVLIFINTKTGGFQWFWFPMFGWGMGLAFHAIGTFGYGKQWEEKKIQQILNKDKQTKWN
jgi:hypothetical protein